jgi:probable rRNA maturation factor
MSTRSSKTGAAAASLSLSFQWATREFKDHRECLPRHRVMRWIKAALSADAEITVRIVGAEEGQMLNKQFRQKDHATNVLTFDYAHTPVVMADLILCAPVIEREAQEQGKPLAAHYAHMLVHGTLHAQGWDHIKAKEAKAMEAFETTLMQQLGFDDPYATG